MEQTEFHRLFTYEERKSILTRTHNICACCGKKLTTKIMTVEHIIPLSKGGTNDMKNLIALCYDCNKLKGGMIYLPSGFYSALVDTSLLKEIESYVKHWFRTVSDQFNLELFPLIAPRCNIFLVPSSMDNNRKLTFVKQFLLQWRQIGNNDREEIEAVTDLNINEIRQKTNQMYGTENHLVALYSLRKVTTDKILAVVCILYDLQNHHIFFYMPWTCMVKTQQPGILWGIVNAILTSIIDMAGMTIYTYTLATDYEHSLDKFRDNQPKPRHMGYGYCEMPKEDVIDCIQVFHENPLSK